MQLGIVFVPHHSCGLLPEPNTNKQQGEQLEKQATGTERDVCGILSHRVQATNPAIPAMKVAAT